jgi:hypothetical protein
LSGGSRREKKVATQLAIARMLLVGPKRLREIAADLGAPSQTACGLLKSPWFEKVSGFFGAYQLADAGRAAVNGSEVNSNGKMPAEPAGDLATRLGSYLKLNGPKRRDFLPGALGVAKSEIQGLIGDLGDKHAWFEKDNGMITLSSEGHGAFRKDDDEQG